MEITPSIHRAIAKISEIHHGQTRKSEALPYIVHPYAVAILLAHYTNDKDTIVAGLLHDVLEDVEPEVYNKDDICRDFSYLIYKIVQEVSVIETAHRRSDLKLSWRDRKIQYLNQLKQASQPALMIAAADKIHFLQSIMNSYEEQGEALWEKFNASPEDRFWFCQEVLKILQQRIDNPIVTKLDRVLTKAKTILIRGVSVN